MIDEPTEDELIEAARLREELEGKREHGEMAELASALKAAHRPTQISPEENIALVSKAILSASRKNPARPQRSRLIRVAFGAGAALAMAAGILLMFRVREMASSPMATVKAVNQEINRVIPPLGPYAVARTTSALFREPSSALTGSGRIDRIAQARSNDFRENRYRSWGVR